jgi:hypothetical protein
MIKLIFTFKDCISGHAPLEWLAIITISCGDSLTISPYYNKLCAILKAYETGNNRAELGIEIMINFELEKGRVKLLNRCFEVSMVGQLYRCVGLYFKHF